MLQPLVARHPAQTLADLSERSSDGVPSRAPFFMLPVSGKIGLRKSIHQKENCTQVKPPFFISTAEHLFSWPQARVTLPFLNFVRSIMPSSTKGVIYALCAFLIWGICPLYFKLLTEVPAAEILTHRIIWSCVLLLALLLATRQWYKVQQVLRQPRQLLNLTLSALLVAGNWLLFIWSVNHNYLLEASLGYYINPLFNILLGMLFLGERLRRLQWVAVALATLGVLIQVVLIGHLPWIALTLAGSFGIYGLIRKQIPVDAQCGLFVETLLLLPLALIYLFGIADSTTSQLAQNTVGLNLLLLAAGVVTTVPLLLFTAGARLIPLSTLGFIQYLGPSIMFLLALFYYGEPVQAAKLITFGFIWSALALFSWDSWRRSRRNNAA